MNGMNEHRLKQFFKFDDTDLSANRNGRLSQEQRKKIEAETRAERISARDSAGILFVIALMGVGMGLLIVVNAPQLSAKLVIGFLLCLLWPFAWGSRVVGILKSAPPMTREEQVRVAAGPVRVSRYEDDFILEVNGHQFDLDKNSGGVIEDGEELRVYFLERTEEILSVEKK
jgi:hypothetical protein